MTEENEINFCSAYKQIKKSESNALSFLWLASLLLYLVKAAVEDICRVQLGCHLEKWGDRN
jgi:hypothetical protein